MIQDRLIPVSVLPSSAPSGVVTYVPGRVPALITRSLVLLADVDPFGPLLSSCWSAAERGGGIDDLRDMITGSGPAGVPDFALVGTDGSGVRLLVGGRARAEYAPPGAGPVVTTANGVPGWYDERLAAISDVRLVIGQPGGGAAPRLPVGAGIVLASFVVVPGTAGADARVTAPDLRSLASASVPLALLAPVEPAAPPMVQAVRCPNNHLNAPFVVGTCRVCGAPVPQQLPFAAPRPVLGLLVFSTGESIPVDRDMLLGRAPAPAGGDSVRIVTLPSPDNDLSRAHARVLIDGWLVQLTDLGSTNGTLVTVPGQQPVRLRAHDPFTVVPGTLVNLADEVTFRFEVPG